MDKTGRWTHELTALAQLISAEGLEETTKWDAPVFCHLGKKVVGIAGFNSHFALWFFQGAQMPDPLNVLVNAQEGITKNTRQWRFSTWNDFPIEQVQNYIREAIVVSETLEPLKPNPLVIKPGPLLQAALDQNQAFQTAFSALPPYQQKDAILHIDGAKKEETKQKRLRQFIEKLSL
ncbi:MAG: hypothetical protein CFE24_08710 [Flavobacterium sp. BFFFF2]|nr:MAG: hypothetical protein CFE24_08710 [Flavobacterium sp. BFFFF2]